MCFSVLSWGFRELYWVDNSFFIIEVELFFFIEVLFVFGLVLLMFFCFEELFGFIFDFDDFDDFDVFFFDVFVRRRLEKFLKVLLVLLNL